MTRLSVNINKIAWLRNARQGDKPDLVDYTRKIIEAGAHGITVHPRPDQRHITPDDVYQIKQLLGEYSNIEFNIEGNPSAGERDNGYPGFAALVSDTQPNQCTLVPDSDNQTTSDHGFNLLDSVVFDTVKAHIRRYSDQGIRTSLFLDPEEALVEKAHATGTDRIELYTGPWVEQVEEHGITSNQAKTSLEKYRTATNKAVQLGLEVNAGHDLNQENLATFCAIGHIKEVSIGHALISEALLDGLTKTVQNYLQQLT